MNLPKAEKTELDFPVYLKWVQLRSSSGVAEECVNAVLGMPDSAAIVVAHSDITLLVPTHRIGLEAITRLEDHNCRICHIFDQTQQEQKSRKMAFFMGDARIKACIIHSFKGWEARYIVIGITPDTDLEAAYVAMSRLKRHNEGSYLTVICSNAELETFGTAWAAFEKR